MFVLKKILCSFCHNKAHLNLIGIKQKDLSYLFRSKFVYENQLVFIFWNKKKRIEMSKISTPFLSESSTYFFYIFELTIKKFTDGSKLDLCLLVILFQNRIIFLSSGCPSHHFLLQNYYIWANSLNRPNNYFISIYKVIDFYTTTKFFWDRIMVWCRRLRRRPKTHWFPDNNFSLCE